MQKPFHFQEQLYLSKEFLFVDIEDQLRRDKYISDKGIEANTMDMLAVSHAHPDGDAQLG